MLQRGMTKSIPVARLSDQELLAEVKVAAGRERDATVRLIALLAQVDERRLYLGEGCSSLFTYCTQVLHLSEHAAYGRIEAARAARRFPVVLDLLSEGSLTLTAVTLLAPHLTEANHADVLESARHKSKRDVEHIVARLRPQPAVPSLVRKLPAPAPPPDAAAEAADCRAPLLATDARTAPDRVSVSLIPPPRAAVVAPLGPECYKVQFTVSRETHDKLRRAQDLLRHSIPTGDPAAIFDWALTLLVSDLERAKLATTERPRAGRPVAAGSRHIPAAVRREVWKRDAGQCAFVGTHGRCPERGFLEFHHVEPYAAGGAATVENIELRCRAHNMHEAEQYFGSRLPLLVRESRPAYAPLNSVRTERAAVGPRAPRAFLRAGATRSARGSASCRGKPASPRRASRCGVGWGLSCASKASVRQRNRVTSWDESGAAAGGNRSEAGLVTPQSRHSESPRADHVAPAESVRGAAMVCAGTRSGPSSLLGDGQRLVQGGFEEAGAFGLCRAELSLQLVAYGHQLVDFGDDAVLFGEGGHGNRNPSKVSQPDPLKRHAVVMRGRDSL